MMLTQRQGWWRILFAAGLAVAMLLPAPARAQEDVDAAAKQLIAAYGFIKQGQFKFAADELTSFLNKYPKHAEATNARYALCISLYRVQRYDEAAKEIPTVLADAAFKQRDEALAILGHCHLTLKQNAKALAAFDELLQKHADSKYAEGAALNQAQVLFMMEKKEESAKACQSFLDKFPKSAHRANGLYTLALAQHSLTKLPDADPSDNTFLTVDDLAQRATKLIGAEATLATLLKEFPDSPYTLDALLLLGQCQESRNKLKEAGESFELALAKSPLPRQAEVRYRLAVVQHNSLKYDDAIKQLETILAEHKDTPYAGAARLQLGKSQYDANRVADARKTLTAVADGDKERAGEARYWIAQCDIADKKYADAARILDALALTTPAPTNIDEIDFYRAVCQMQLEQYSAATTAFASFSTKYAKSPRLSEATYHRAFCLHRQQKYEDSLKACEAVVAATDSTWKYPANKLWAENLYLLADYKAAADKFAQLSASAATDDKLQIESRIAQCAYFGGDYTKAVDLLAKLSTHADVGKHSELRRVIFLHGDALLQLRKPKDAVDPLKRYLALNPRDEEARYKLGLAQQGAGEEPAAFATYGALISDQASKDDSAWVQNSLLAYGQIAYRDKDHAKAAAALSRLQKVKPAPALAAPAMYLLAWIDYDAKKYEPAAQKFGDLIAAHSKHELAVDAMFQRGVCLSEAKKHEAALAALNEYITAQPKGKHAAAARQFIAAALTQLGKHDEAAKALAALAGEEDSRSDVILYDLAWSHRAIKADAEKRKATAEVAAANDAAIKAYQELLKDFKSSKLATPARIELAELLYTKEQYKEAAAILEEAMKDAGTDAKTLALGQYRLGWCYAKLKDDAKAAATLSEFAAKNAQHELAASALYQAGMSSRTISKNADAIARFSTLLKDHGKHELAAAATLRLGETLAETNDFAASAKSYEQFIAGFPKSEFIDLAYFGLGWALEQQKQYDKARTWYGKTIEKTNTITAARAQFQIGETFFAEKKYEHAAKELLKVDNVYAYPQWSAKALYEAGQAFEQLSQFDDAKKNYQRVLDAFGKEPVADLAKKRLDALK